MIARRIAVLSLLSILQAAIAQSAVAETTTTTTLSSTAVTSTTVSTTTTTAPAAAVPKKDQVTIGIVDDESKGVFEEKVLPFIKDQASPCARCEFVNFSPYDKDGAFVESKLIDGLKNAAKTSFMFISWNRPMASDQQKIVDTLKKIVKDGTLIVATAGTAHMDQSTLPLGKTVLGQVPEIVIIGEMRERERLLQQSFYGPEMLTAIRPPKGIEEAGYSPALFASKLAQNFHRKTGQEWLAHFRDTKAKSRKMWPDVNDFFRR